MRRMKSKLKRENGWKDRWMISEFTRFTLSLHAKYKLEPEKIIKPNFSGFRWSEVKSGERGGGEASKILTGVFSSQTYSLYRSQERSGGGRL